MSKLSSAGWLNTNCHLVGNTNITCEALSTVSSIHYNQKVKEMPVSSGLRTLNHIIFYIFRNQKDTKKRIWPTLSNYSKRQLSNFINFKNLTYMTVHRCLLQFLRRNFYKQGEKLSVCTSLVGSIMSENIRK